MADQFKKLGVKIEAIPSLKPGLDKAKGEFQKWGASAMPSLSKQRQLPTSISPQAVSKVALKQTKTQIQLLKSIDKSLKMGSSQRVSALGQGSGLSVPQQGGPLSLLGKGGGLMKAGAASTVGAGLAISGLVAKSMYDFLKKSSSGFREGITSQLDSVLGLQKFTGDVGGAFLSSRGKTMTGEERASFASMYEKAFPSKKDPYAETKLAMQEEMGSRIYQATGTDINTLAKINIGSGMGTKGTVGGRLDPLNVGLIANRAGLGGMNTRDFAQDVLNVVEQRMNLNMGSSKGSSTAGLIGVTQAGQTMVGRKIGREASQGLTSSLFQGASLQGGPSGSYALGALMRTGMSFKEARKSAFEGDSVKNLEIILKDINNFAGEDKLLRNQMLRGMPGLGISGSDPEINSWMEQTLNNIQKGIGKDTSLEERKDFYNLSEEEMRTGKRQILLSDKGQKINEEFGRMTETSSKFAGELDETSTALSNLKRGLSDFLGGLMPDSNKNGNP